MKDEILSDLTFMRKYFDDNLIQTISKNCESSGILFHDLVKELIKEEFWYFKADDRAISIRAYLMMTIDIVLDRE
jgi:hypothetical protein